jgi:hypothetical protein
MTDVNRKLQALRDDAWQAVLSSVEYREFKVLDDVVKQMGEVVVGQAKIATSREVSLQLSGTATAASKPVKRVTQIDVAKSVLRRHGEPLTINEWLSKSLAQGIGIKGSQPLPNFRSTVSRSDLFYNFTLDRIFYWWLTGVDLPEKWKKATEPDLLSQSAAFVHDSQEGGEADAHIT